MKPLPFWPTSLYSQSSLNLDALQAIFFFSTNASLHKKTENAWFTKIREIEGEKQRAINRTRDELLQSRTLLKELISADESSLRVLELLEAGLLEETRSNLKRRKAFIAERIQSFKMWDEA
ncbi:unnamed protein product [Blepharisma stoltei]|uniref:Uncharacterized protein n=1 Tax=Blepharisma stoltei TaxID=1481888 RepID=A0AAU9IIF7_9CILI|nr:unnamed protein product [Blepharisma stoltei]